MKINSNVGKISKIFGIVIFTSCITYPLVYMFITGIKILTRSLPVWENCVFQA